MENIGEVSEAVILKEHLAFGHRQNFKRPLFGAMNQILSLPRLLPLSCQLYAEECRQPSTCCVLGGTIGIGVVQIVELVAIVGSRLISVHLRVGKIRLRFSLRWPEEG